MADEPPRQPGLQWIGEAWFGAQIGGTLWLLPLAGFAAARDALTAVTATVVFLVCNTVGTLMWIRRARLAVYPCLQGLILLMGLGTVVVAIAVNERGALALLDGNAYIGNALPYWMLLLYPGLMIVIAIRQKR